MGDYILDLTLFASYIHHLWLNVNYAAARVS
jgi:hypothetical protein